MERKTRASRSRQPPIQCLASFFAALLLPPPPPLCCFILCRTGDERKPWLGPTDWPIVVASICLILFLSLANKRVSFPSVAAIKRHFGRPQLSTACVCVHSSAHSYSSSPFVCLATIDSKQNRLFASTFTTTTLSLFPPIYIYIYTV